MGRDIWGRVKELLLIGKTKYDIAAACDRAGFKDYKFVDTLEEAVSIAAADAESGDCVLLSPHARAGICSNAISSAARYSRTA